MCVLLTETTSARRAARFDRKVAVVMQLEASLWIFLLDSLYLIFYALLSALRRIFYFIKLFPILNNVY